MFHWKPVNFLQHTNQLPTERGRELVFDLLTVFSNIAPVRMTLTVIK